MSVRQIIFAQVIEFTKVWINIIDGDRSTNESMGLPESERKKKKKC